MWKIFYNPENDFLTTFQSLESWKSTIFSQLRVEMTQYFARKVVVYFDNMMIIHQKRGSHNNLMESLSMAEKEMHSVDMIFPTINIHAIKEEEGYALITCGLNDQYIDTLSPYNFQMIENNANLTDEKENVMKNMAWSTLVFDVQLVNFANDWINHTPSLEERSILQAEDILMNNHFKKNPMSLMEKINFKENLKSHPQYEELYQKVLRIMPKIESSLQQEWRTAMIQTRIQETIGQIKKSKSGI